MHSFYSDGESSGENNVVLAQIALLRTAGHEVLLISSKTAELEEKFLYPLKAAISVAFGTGNSPLTALIEFAPNVVLIHNLFPNFASNWIRNCPFPTFQFIHNFRLFCANGLFYRDSKICFDCRDISPLAGFIHASYRSSRFASLPLTLRHMTPISFRPEIQSITKFVTLAPHARDIMISNGIPETKVVVLPNFVSENGIFTKEASLEDRWVTVGRLSNEKGILKIVENWPNANYLDIYGEGPERTAIERQILGKPKITLKGRVSNDALRSKLNSYRGAVFSSSWLEVNPLVILEYLSAGLPIISMSATTNLPGLNPELIVNRDFNLEEELSRLIKKVVLNRENLSSKAIESYKENFSPSAWLKGFHGLLNNHLH